jgi:hypothetical protein
VLSPGVFFYQEVYMKIESTTVRKLMITDVSRLDPIAVYLEDLGTGRGKIVITCYDKSWTSYWGAMGDRTISAFVKSCDNGYLIKNLSSIHEEIDDYDALKLDMFKQVLKQRRSKELSEREARDYYVTIDDYEAEELCKDKPDIMTMCYGDDWWYCIPKKINPEYVYLDKILTVVKEALIGIS